MSDVDKETTPDADAEAAVGGENAAPAEEAGDTEGAEEDKKPLGVKVEVEDLGSWKRSLTIEVPAESVKDRYEDAFKELSRSVFVPGFRKGHVPRVRLLKQFGEALGEDLKVRLVSDASEEAFEASELEPVADPEMWPVETSDEPEAEPDTGKDEDAGESETDRKKKEAVERFKRIKLDPDGPLAFKAVVEVKPVFELPEYKGLKLARKKVEVTDEQVGRYIDSMRRRDADYAAVEDGRAEPGDRLTVTGRIELVAEGDEAGEQVWDAENEICHLVEGGLLGLPVPVGRGDVEGMAPGEARTIDVTIPDGFKTEEHRGKAAKLTIKLEELKRPELPPLDDEAAKMLGATDVEALRSYARESLRAQAETESREDLERQVFDGLIAQVDFELPEGLLARASRSSEYQSVIRLARMGVLTPEDAASILSAGPTDEPAASDTADDGETSDAGPDDKVKKIGADLRRTAHTATERGLKGGLILTKISRAENIDVGDDDVEEEIYRRAMASGRTPVAVRGELERQGGVDSLKSDLATGKVVNFLIEHADITDAE